MQYSNNSKISEIKQSIINILIKINAHFDYPMDDKKLRLVSEDWVNALFGYSDPVIKHAYNQIIQHSKKRPTLADFVSQCGSSKKIITANNQGINSQPKKDYEKWDNYRAAIARQYGEEYAHRHCDPAKAEYDIAKAEGRFEEYKDKKLKQLTDFLKSKRLVCN